MSCEGTTCWQIWTNIMGLGSNFLVWFFLRQTGSHGIHHHHCNQLRKLGKVTGGGFFRNIPFFISISNIYVQIHIHIHIHISKPISISISFFYIYNLPKLFFHLDFLGSKWVFRGKARYLQLISPGSSFIWANHSNQTPVGHPENLPPNPQHDYVWVFFGSIWNLWWLLMLLMMAAVLDDAQIHGRRLETVWKTWLQ